MDTLCTLFIVDDHQLVIDGIISMTEQSADWEVIGYANDGEEAVKKVPILKPDIVLMDLEMPRLNGLQATEKILKVVPDQRIVILTLHHEKPIVQKLIKLGAWGYILKNAPRQEFLQGLDMVRQGSKFYSSQLTESVLEVSSMEVKKETNVKMLSLLSDRERDVLRLVAEGVSSKEMADQLHLSPRTIETYRKSLLKKLDARNSADLIRIAIREGLIYA